MNYRISKERWEQSPFMASQGAYKDGYTDAENNLVPLLEERDKAIVDLANQLEALHEGALKMEASYKELLKECREEIEGWYLEGQSDCESRRQLLTKLQSITNE